VDISELADEPILLLRREFGSRGWFDAACDVSRFRPRVRLESAAPQTLIELAAVDYGVAVVPSTVVVRTEGVRVVPLTQGKSPLGRWSMVAWDRQRQLPQYARQFVDELVGHSRLAYPGMAFTRRAPPLPRPKQPPE
jgi:LysR family cyn operon transcriptional activator